MSYSLTAPNPSEAGTEPSAPGSASVSELAAKSSDQQTGTPFCSGKLNGHSLELQQQLLLVQPAPVTAQSVTGAHNAVAGNDDGDWIRAQGVAGGATRRRGQPPSACPAGSRPSRRRYRPGPLPRLGLGTHGPLARRPQRRRLDAATGSQCLSFHVLRFQSLQAFVDTAPGGGLGASH